MLNWYIDINNTHRFKRTLQVDMEIVNITKKLIKPSYQSSSKTHS